MPELKDVFTVDVSSPSGLRHITSRARRVTVGDVAGCIVTRDKCQYWQLSVSHKPYRVVWELLYGPIPEGKRKTRGGFNTAEEASLWVESQRPIMHKEFSRAN